MKLNKRGWGTKELIISAAIIFALLLVCSYYIHRLYESMEVDSSYKVNNNNTKSYNTNTGTKNEEKEESKTPVIIDYTYYKAYETQMESAAIAYIKDYDKEINDDNRLINMIDLVDLNYIELLYDKYDNSVCLGYVIITDNNGVAGAKSYISCTNYTTEGY